MKNISTASAHWEDTLENGFGTISAEILKFLQKLPIISKHVQKVKLILPHQKNFWELLMQPVLVWHSQWF